MCLYLPDYILFYILSLLFSLARSRFSISKSLSRLNGNNYVTIQEVKDVLPYILKHRINTIEKKHLSQIKIKPTNGCLFHKMYISRNSLEKKTKNFIIAIESTTINKLVSWIKEAQKNNQISKKIKPIETARIIQSMHRSLNVLLGGPLNKKELIDTKDQFLNLLKLH